MAADWPGLGPQSRAWLAEAGIATPQQLAAQDPFEVHARIKAHQPRASFNLLYALIDAIEGRDWREVAHAERASVLLRLDAMELLGRH